MGKLPNSKIHELYSDWHWSLVNIDQKYKRLYVSDIDRLWIEYDYATNAVVAIIDLKWEDSNDGFTPTEKGIYEWFERVGARYYIVYVSKDFSNFRVMNSEHRQKMFSPTEYADWLLSLRSAPKRTQATRSQTISPVYRSAP
jgi:hypothetical protein